MLSTRNRDAINAARRREYRDADKDTLNAARRVADRERRARRRTFRDDESVTGCINFPLSLLIKHSLSCFCRKALDAQRLTSFKYRVTLDTQIRRLNEQRLREYGKSINQFTRNLVVNYIAYIDTTDITNAQYDCQALLDAARALRSGAEESTGRSDEFRRARDLSNSLKHDMNIINDAWYYLSQGKSKLLEAFNDGKLLCQRCKRG